MDLGSNPDQKSTAVELEKCEFQDELDTLFCIMFMYNFKNIFKSYLSFDNCVLPSDMYALRSYCWRN